MAITGTDLELLIRSFAPALETYREGAAVIPARQLADIVRRITDPRIEIEAAGPHVVLTYAGGEVQLATFPPEDFPELPGEEEKGVAFELEVAFRDALRAVLYAASKDELRPVFTGVQFELVESRLTLAATDGHRLAAYEMPVEATGSVVSVIPAKALREVERILGHGAAGRLRVGLGGSTASFAAADVEILSRLIEGRFPEWRAAVPQSPPQTYLRGSLQHLLSALERAQVMAAQDPPTIILKVSDGQVTVEARSELGGLKERLLDLEAGGEEVEIAFNASYLLDALRATGGEAVEIGLYGKIGPAVVKISGAPGYLGLVLPLRLL